MTQDNRGKNWTQSDYDKLRGLFDSGSSLDGISKCMGRTPYAIIAKLEGMGLLVCIGRHYHKVDPDPWMTWQFVKLVSEDFEQSMKHV